MKISEAAEFLKSNGIVFRQTENGLKDIEDGPEFVYSVEKKE